MAGTQAPRHSTETPDTSPARSAFQAGPSTEDKAPAPEGYRDHPICRKDNEVRGEAPEKAFLRLSQDSGP